MPLNLSHYERAGFIAWRFETAQFTVALVTEPEEMDPADSFEFKDDIEAVRSGSVEWFTAGVLVFGPDGDQIGSDWLGGCAYTKIADFYESHWRLAAHSRNTLAMKAQNIIICDDFPSMVREAISDARKHLSQYKRLALNIRAI